MKTLWRLLRLLRPHLIWAWLAVIAMAGAALAFVFMVFLVMPIYDELFAARRAAPAAVESAVAEPEGPQASVPAVPDEMAEVGLVKTFNRWLDAGRERLQSLLPRTEEGTRLRDRWSLLVLALAALFLKNLLTYIGHYAFYRTGLAAVRDLRDQLMDALLAQSSAYFQQQPTAVLMSRVTNDVEQITVFVSDRFGDLFQDTFTILGLLVLVFSLNFELALWSLVIGPALLWPVIHFARKLRRRSHQSQERLGEMNSVLDEVLKGFRVVKAFGMELFESVRFRKTTQDHFKANLKARKIQALSTPVMEVLGGAAILVLFLVVSGMIDRGEMTLGSFSAFLFGLNGMYGPAKRLNRLNLAAQMAIAAGDRAFAVLDAPVIVRDRPGARELAGVEREIRFDNVSFAYEPEKPVLRNLDLVLPAGRVLALVGPSGAGKSTVAQLLPRFWDVTSGTITIDGHDLRDLTLISLRRHIGLVTQETVLFNTTIAANIAYGREIDHERLRRCARAAFAEEFIAEFPDGYDTVVGEAGVRMSGGQRQRIAVARALYKDPPILILDEATSALDAEAEAVVQRALENLMRGRTTLVIAHRLATVRGADTIAVLEHGRVVEQGTHGELLALGGAYSHLARLQGLGAGGGAGR